MFDMKTTKKKSGCFTIICVIILIICWLSELGDSPNQITYPREDHNCVSFKERIGRDTQKYLFDFDDGTFYIVISTTSTKRMWKGSFEGSFNTVVTATSYYYPYGTAANVTQFVKDSYGYYYRIDNGDRIQMDYQNTKALLEEIYWIEEKD